MNAAWRRLALRGRLSWRALRRRRGALLAPVAARFEAWLRLVAPAPTRFEAVPEPPRGGWILLPVARPESALRLARVAADIAEARSAGVLIVAVAPPDGPSAGASLDAATVGERWPATRLAGDAVRAAGLPAGLVVREAADIGQALRREAARRSADLMIFGWSDPPMDDASARSPDSPAEAWRSDREAEALRDERRALPASLRAVLEYPPADVVVVGGRGEAPHRRLLVPVVDVHDIAGDALEPLRVATELAHRRGSVTALHIAPEGASLGDLESASRGLARALELVGLASAGRLVLRAPSVVEAVLDAVTTRGYDGVVMAAPRRSYIDRLLFGEVQLAIARRCEVPVLVVRARSGATTYLALRLWHAVYDRVPKLPRGERDDVARAIAAAAEPDADFLVLIGLSSTIAAFGLLQDSPAVIIGAMLVAPLMAAIVAAGLGVVQGNVALIRRSLWAAGTGAALAVAVGVASGLAQAQDLVTPEMAARTRPQLLDLGVALASGVAGAYALSRRELSASLPGVAIAAALVPPLAVCGLGLSMSRWDVALGAALLFGTNFVAIAAAGGLTFLLLGFGPRRGEPGARRVLERGAGTAVGLLLVVTALLAAITVRLADRAELDRRAERALESALASSPAGASAELAALAIAELPGGVVDIEATVRWPADAIEGFTADAARALRDDVAARLSRPVSLRVSIAPTRALGADEASGIVPDARPDLPAATPADRP